MSDPLKSFEGKRILFVEDEDFLEQRTRAEFERIGARIVGPTRSAAWAIVLIKGAQIDAVIIDLRMDEEQSFTVADELGKSGIPFVFAARAEHAAPFERQSAYILSSDPQALLDIARGLFTDDRLH